MNPIFSYSFDRETFAGSFPTRHEAVAAGIKRAREYPEPPTTLYVGQRIMPNPRAFGNARVVIDNMARRVQDDVGDIADGYLRGLAEQQVTDLDTSLEKTIVQWMARHDLTPRFSTIEAISEHPVPSAPSAPSRSQGGDEVQYLGQSEYPFGA